MGSLTFDSMTELLKFRAGNNAALDSAGVSAFNYYGIWTNQSYRQLCSQDYILGLKKRLYFPQLLTTATATTATSTAFVLAPSDALYITEVFDTTNLKKLDHITWKQYVEYTDRTTPASYGDPSEWTRAGTSIYLHPTIKTGATNQLSIYYKKLPVELSGTDTTVIGSEWDDVIIELATYKMFVWTNEDQPKIKQAKESFLEMAAGLADIYHNESKDRNESFAPSTSYMA
jgi:hypothetical protein